jgi:hypothetical protein
LYSKTNGTKDQFSQNEEDLQQYTLMNELAEPYSKSQRVVRRGDWMGSIAGDSETETSSELGDHGTNNGPRVDAV